jgi:uncharacterized protein YbaR (Trm112 family)
MSVINCPMCKGEPLVLHKYACRGNGMFEPSTCGYCKGAGYLYVRPPTLDELKEVMSPTQIDKLSKYYGH